MKSIRFGASLATLFVVVGTGACADVLSVAPTKVVVLPMDGSGVSRVALQFDLAGLRQGEGRRIDNAYLEWTVNGVPADRRTEFWAQEVVQDWIPELVVSGQSLIAVRDESLDRWPITPRSYQRNGALVRLNLDSLVANWTSGQTLDHGVLLATDAVSSDVMSSQLTNVRLVVLYGFIQWDGGS